ncbi:Hypothetical protein LUCI_4629 [Lucifera butyrica]|uniref:Uncharacterized protein n=1 Tax=Lucifera butyrica TaxID=1351585 RepID=A0A498RDE7_9FIRM|nr:Hypothetical protein LUCI_4629 [Lucifera butyrica]
MFPWHRRTLDITLFDNLKLNLNGMYPISGMIFVPL